MPARRTDTGVSTGAPGGTTGRPGYSPLHRRGFRGESSRALLLVLIGEFVWADEQDSVWSSALIRGMSELGFQELATRKAMHRTAESGLIEAHKVGRQVRWDLTDFGRQVLVDGSPRVFGFAGMGPTWSGDWLVVTLRIPETQRKLRHFVHTRLTWAGLGSPGPGVWITPQADLAEEVAAIVQNAGLEHVIASYIGRFGPLGSEKDVVAQAWDLDELNTSYREFIGAFQASAASTSPAMFGSYVRLLHAWRGFAYLDPRIPEHFLPAGWAGAAAGAAFQECLATWRAPAHEYWRGMLAD